MKLNKVLASGITAVFALALLVPANEANAVAPSVQVPGSRVTGFSTNFSTSVADLSATPPQVLNYGDSTVVRVTLTATNGSIDMTGSNAGLTRAAGYNSWSATTISFSGTQANVNTALGVMKLRGSSVGDVDVLIEVSTGTGSVNSANSHYYDVISSSLTWSAAYTDAQTKTVPSASGGTCVGYLVTITSPSEQTFVKGKVRSNSWIGASDDFNYIFTTGTTKKYADQTAAEGGWHWVTGPESGTQFLTSNSNTAVVGSEYNNFASGEPNNYSGSEAYGQIYTSDGYWNDLGPADTQAAYIVEFGDGGCTPAATASSSSATYSANAQNVQAFNASNFTTGGNATVSGSEIALTQDVADQYGTVWTKSRSVLTSDFEVNAEVYLGANNDVAGADGMAFVIQTASSAQGSSGGGLGYMGINKSFAVEMDTYDNGGGEAGLGDHIALMKDGVVTAHSAWSQNPVSAVVNLDDDHYRKFRFYWDTTNNKVTVQIDLDADGTYETGETVYDAVAIDMETYFGAGVPFYWGFTAATGGATNLQKVKITSYMATGRSNTPPTVTASNVTMDRSATQSVAVTLSDDLTAQDQWTLTASSSNTSVATVSVAPTTSSATAASFTLQSTAQAGSATITIVAKDADGASTTITITATVTLVAPGAPTAVSVARASEGILTVSWTAPTNNGGTNITDYLLDISTDAGVTWSAVTESVSALTSANLSGTVGTAYKFRVKAVNSSMTSIESSPSASFTLYGLPSSPTNLTATPSTTSITLSWTAPTNIGGATVSDYLIDYSIDNGVTWVAVTDAVSSATSSVISGLTQAIDYIFRVVTKNSANFESSASSPSTATRLATPAPQAAAPAPSPASPSPSPSASPSSSPSPTATSRPTPRPTPTASRPVVVPTLTPAASPSPTQSAEVQVVPAPVLQPTVEATPNVIYETINEIPQVLINVLSAPIAFESINSQPVLPELSPLESAAVVNGKAVEVQLVVNATNDGYVLKGTDFKVTLNATGKNGEMLALDNSGNIVLNADRFASFTGSGYAPGSIIKVWLFSSPTALTQVVADKDGNFKGIATIPSSVPEGDHTIQLNGLSTNGEVRSVAMGVVLGNLPVKENSADSSAQYLSLILGAIGFAVIAILVVAVIRRRRS